MNPVELVPLLALTATLTREMLWLTAIFILISNLDDLAVDFLWLGCIAFKPQPPLPPPPAEPGTYAILVPAWDEATVIAPMLHCLIGTLDHPDFTIFVGIYPNDPDTSAAVASVCSNRIIPVQTSRPGPTTKADCLNHLWQAALAHEAATSSRFTAIVLHDAEDLVHPFELRLFDRHMPALAMVQLPVLPLVDPKSPWISGHYLDEFAQNHTKDMMVRTLLDTPIPSAGVATAIDRTALGRLAGSDNRPFDETSLTEDYEIGHKLHRLGLKSRMVRHRIDGKLVATREYFPATLAAAVRQKSRWLTGIALSGWDRLGWQGSHATRWMLLRDRKGLFSSTITIIAYAALALVVAQVSARALISEASGIALPPLLLDSGNSALVWLLGFNAFLLFWRLGWRAFFTGREHGARQALLSIPRAVCANAINALSAFRAIERYRASMLSSAPPTWDKTEHRFPSATSAPHG